jgi:hypothetical protein
MTRTRIAAVVAVLAVVGLAVAFGIHPWSSHLPDRSPARAADYTSVVDKPPNGWRSATVWAFNPDQASLAGPHFSLRYFFADALVHDPIDGYRAAAGHEFLFVSGDQGYGPAYQPGPADPVSAAVIVDGVRRPLPKVPTAGLVVSVPTGHGAALTVTDAGRTQSLDLRAGSRRPDAIAGYYRAHQLDTTGLAYHGDGVAAVARQGVDVAMSVEFVASNVSFEPWVPGFGWAQPGRAWLQMSRVTVSSRVSAQDDVLALWALGTDFITDFAASFTVVVADGSRSAAKPGSTWGPFSQVELFFDVPEQYGTAALLVRPTGMLRAKGRDPIAAVWRRAPPAGQLTLVKG